MEFTGKSQGRPSRESDSIWLQRRRALAFFAEEGAGKQHDHVLQKNLVATLPMYNLMEPALDVFQKRRPWTEQSASPF